MKYNHLRLLRQLMDQGKSQRKIVEYFQKEGYTENQVIGEINQYEQEKHASSALRKLPEEEFTIESAPERIPQKQPFLPLKIIMAILAIVSIILLTVVLIVVL